MTKAIPERYQHLRQFAFGDNPALADELVPRHSDYDFLEVAG